MSEPTYRIETEHVPSLEYPSIPWQAHIYRVTDGAKLTTKHGATEEDAADSARAAIIALASREPGHTFYVSEEGALVAEPQSLRA